MKKLSREAVATAVAKNRKLKDAFVKLEPDGSAVLLENVAELSAFENMPQLLARAEALRDQVMKTWNPPATHSAATEGDIAQTATMITLAYLLGPAFVRANTAPQIQAIASGLAVIDQVFHETDPAQNDGAIAMQISDMPQTVLSNGVRVANFSSGHDFQFEDGSILEACERDRVQAGSLAIKETVVEDRVAGSYGKPGAFRVVQITPTLTSVLVDLIKMTALSEVDVIIVPRSLLDACKDYKATASNDLDTYVERMFTFRRTERVGPCSINTFCQ